MRWILILLFLLSACTKKDDDQNVIEAKPEVQLPTIPDVVVGSWRKLPQGVSWHIQFTGDFTKMPDVQFYDVGFQSESEKKIVKELRAKNKYVSCYFSAGSFEDWRSDAKDFPTTAIGNKMSGWDEKWLDIRDARVFDIMKKRMDMAKSLGCDAVDADNVDAYTNKSGFSISKDDQIKYNKNLANYAHSIGLAIGLKNALLIIKDIESVFDFAINEQCNQYKECYYYDDTFLKNNKPVFQIEYKSENCKSVPGRSVQLKKLGLNEYFKEC